MSELVNACGNRMNFRWQLLATASAIALLACTYGAGEAKAADDDSDRPTLWIELGGGLSRLDDGQEAFAPVFPGSPPRPSIFSPSQKFERLPLYSLDEYGQISLQPENSDWVLSASARYGRSTSHRSVHQRTNPQPFIKYYYTSNPNPTSGVISRHRVKNVDTPQTAKFADTDVQNSEHHLIVDFQAGKDVGLGMFGRRGSSVLSAGVRFAQFSTKSDITLKSDPDWQFHYKYLPSLVGTRFPSSKFATGQIYHSNQAYLRAARSFHGVGPSISWNASAPVEGNTKDGELAFDWGVNAAILFGRQRTKVDHHAIGQYHSAGKYSTGGRHVVYQPTPVDVTRVRTVTVPNVGGFAGFSFRIESAKVSAGYRADFFWGAMDGGIDAARKENVGFYGPFASVSVGLGG
jgi:hypothetical protein